MSRLYSSTLFSADTSTSACQFVGVVVSGEYRFNHLLRVDGKFNGTLKSEGSVIVGEKGEFCINYETSTFSSSN